MERVKELQSELVKLRDKANEIEETAKTEERQITADEYKALDGLLNQIDECEAMILSLIHI